MKPVGTLASAGILAASAALALLCGAAPLFAYTASLATFGLAHVATELRYVDQRFSARLGRGVLRALLALLGVIVLLRIAAFVPAASEWPLQELELIAVAGLAGTAAAHGLRRGEPVAAALSAAVVGALAFGLARAPATTLVVLALLHNLTPVGFLAERLRGPARRRVLALCALVFGAVPAVILSGALTAWLRRAGAWNPDLAPFGVGPVEAHLGAFVPGPWLDQPFAIDLFATAAYLQCVHYAVVIGVLPRLGAVEGEGAPSSLVRWPRRAAFAALVGIASAVALAGFVQAFCDARRVYGVVSSLHAWSEVPVLLLSAGAGFRMARAECRLDPSPGQA